MGRIGAAAIGWQPLLALAAYACLIADYRRYLDGHLRYIRPDLAVAPEDILGLGFWAPWLKVTVWFSIACVVSYRFGLRRSASYWVPLSCVFGLLSLVDFFLYGTLERQVLAS